MQILAVIIVAALTFGVCFLLDKGYAKTFRGQAQHKSGLSVRVNKRYAIFGIIMTVLGLAAIFTGMSDSALLFAGGILVLIIGVGLIVYYLTFGIFYDEDTFILSTFGKKSEVYQFRDIRMQQLYIIQGGSVVIELHMGDGRSVSLQSGMEGTYPFLDHAFAAWCRQTGRDPESCAFHDPSKSLWFPTEEEA